MRGKLQKRTKRGKNCGITPAHAGETVHLDSIKDDAADHPRACGENQDTTRARAHHAGSPPRMRGKRHAQIACEDGSGITPAHAGKTD